LVYQNWSLYQLFELILDDAGLVVDDYELDDQLNDIIIPHAWFPRTSHREALKMLASAGIIQVYCTETGSIRVNLHLDATPDVRGSYKDSDIVFESKYPLAVAEQVNYVEVTANQLELLTGETLFENTMSVVVAANTTYTEIFEFSNVPVMGIDSITLTGAGLTVDSYQVYAWGIELTVANNTASPITLTKIVVMGSYLKSAGSVTSVAQDASLIRVDGKIKATVSHQFIQDVVYAQTLADTILNTYKQARYDVVLRNRGDIAIHLGNRISVEDGASGESFDYVMTRQQLNWVGYLEANTEGKRL
jgi:hypothetical protein